MLELGFDPMTPGHDSGTVLHCAAWEGSVGAVRAVLRHPAARALVGHREPTYGATPLGWCCHGAVHSGKPRAQHAAIARLLLEAGAAPGPDTADAPPELLAVIDPHAKRGG
jgi:hypothetical protein